MHLALLGDVMLGRLVNEALARVPPDYPWGDVLPVLRAADAVIVNLECVLADRGRPQPGKTFTFRSDARNVAVLAAAGVRAVSLANNHTLDYGEAALLECLTVLDRAGIAHAGAGRTLEEAQAPATIQVGGATLALVACTDNEPGWAAAADRPGVFHVPVDDPDGPAFRGLLALVAQARAAADLVVVSVHWGPNWGVAPPPAHTEAGRRLIEAGAGVVYGHSAHIVRGAAWWGGGLILYSCGDFIDDYAVDPVERNDWSFVFLLDAAGGRVRRARLVPTVIRDFQARMARPPEREAILARMHRLCADLGTETRRSREGLELPAPA
ncbi:MAG: CapA family protein [Armatimonadota bacterium]|nr:CapA family protein [Armatimonadota bacterium]MDR7485480.1 CapA family protein [Armatimonadota bacterium]MDR7533025.1 CapA family protein [Armatimonadota bacterium]MDR7536803.1 CapA family protein [Armatimonadota bacterium]